MTVLYVDMTRKIISLFPTRVIWSCSSYLNLCSVKKRTTYVFKMQSSELDGNPQSNTEYSREDRDLGTNTCQTEEERRQEIRTNEKRT
jgi:hypothetical protein